GRSRDPGEGQHTIGPSRRPLLGLVFSLYAFAGGFAELGTQVDQLGLRALVELVDPCRAVLAFPLLEREQSEDVAIDHAPRPPCSVIVALEELDVVPLERTDPVHPAALGSSSAEVD